MPQHSGIIKAPSEICPTGPLGLSVFLCGNTHAAGFVDQVFGNAGAGEGQDADGQKFQHGVIAFEPCAGFAIFVPIGLEHHLIDLFGGGPFGGDQIRAFWRAAVNQHHLRVFFCEPCPAP